MPLSNTFTIAAKQTITKEFSQGSFVIYTTKQDQDNIIVSLTQDNLAPLQKNNRGQFTINLASLTTLYFTNNSDHEVSVTFNDYTLKKGAKVAPIADRIEVVGNDNPSFVKKDIGAGVWYFYPQTINNSFAVSNNANGDNPYPIQAGTAITLDAPTALYFRFVNPRFDGEIGNLIYNNFTIASGGNGGGGGGGGGGSLTFNSPLSENGGNVVLNLESQDFKVLASGKLTLNTSAGSTIDTIKASAKSAQDKADANEVLINAQNTTIQTLQGKVTNIEGDSTQAKQDILELQNKTNSNTQAITALQSEKVSIANTDDVNISITKQGESYFTFQKNQPQSGFRNYTGFKFNIKMDNQPEVNVFSLTTKDTSQGVFISAENNKITLSPSATISGVANGVNGTDAVNLQQMNDAIQQSQGNFATKDDVQDAKNELNALITTNSNEINTLKQKTSTLETNVATNTQGLATANQKIQENKTLLDATKAQSDKNKQDIATAQGEIAKKASQEKFAELETKVTTNTGKITTIEGQLTTFATKANLQTLEGKVTQNMTNIGTNTQNIQALQTAQAKNVTLDTAQTITGEKTFENAVIATKIKVKGDSSNTATLAPSENKTLSLKLYDATQANAFLNLDFGSKGQFIGLKKATQNGQAINYEQFQEKVTELVDKINALGSAIQFIGQDTAHTRADFLGGDGVKLFNQFVQAKTGRHAGVGDLVLTNDKYAFVYTLDRGNPSLIDMGKTGISVASNANLGVVKGSTAEGEISIKSDGTMTLSNYTAIKQAIDANTQNLANALNKGATTQTGEGTYILKNAGYKEDKQTLADNKAFVNKGYLDRSNTTLKGEIANTYETKANVPKLIQAKTGDLSQLQTTAKGNLVSAINEINTNNANAVLKNSPTKQTIEGAIEFAQLVELQQVPELTSQLAITKPTQLVTKKIVDDMENTLQTSIDSVQDIVTQLQTDKADKTQLNDYVKYSMNKSINLSSDKLVLAPNTNNNGSKISTIGSMDIQATSGNIILKTKVANITATNGNIELRPSGFVDFGGKKGSNIADATDDADIVNLKVLKAKIAELNLTANYATKAELQQVQSELEAKFNDYTTTADLTTNYVSKTTTTAQQIASELTVPKLKLKDSENTNYLEFLFGTARKAYIGFGSSNNKVFTIKNEDRANKIVLDNNVDVSRALTAQSFVCNGAVQFGTTFKLGYGGTVVKIRPDDNTEKTIEFFDMSVGTNCKFNLVFKNGTISGISPSTQDGQVVVHQQLSGLTQNIQANQQAIQQIEQTLATKASDNEVVKLTSTTQQDIASDIKIDGQLFIKNDLLVRVEGTGNVVRMIPSTANNAFLYLGDPNYQGGRYFQGIDLNDRVKLLNVPNPINAGDAVNKGTLDANTEFLLNIIKSMQTSPVTPYRENLKLNLYGSIFDNASNVGRNMEIAGTNLYGYQVGNFPTNDVPNWTTRTVWGEAGTTYVNDKVAFNATNHSLMISKSASMRINIPGNYKPARGAFTFSMMVKHEAGTLETGSIMMGFARDYTVWRRAFEVKWDSATNKFKFGILAFDAVNLQEWNQFVFVMDNSVVKAYTNGVLTNVDSAGGTDVFGSIQLFYSQGNAPATNPNRYPLDKEIKAMRLWSGKALTDAEVAYVYQEDLKLTN